MFPRTAILVRTATKRKATLMFSLNSEIKVIYNIAFLAEMKIKAETAM